MKIGIVPASIITSENCTARHYLGPTLKEVVTEETKVEQLTRKLKTMQEGLVVLKDAYTKGAKSGVQIIVKD